MIGINDYEDERLEAAEAGAQLIADKLNALGYEVVLGTNASTKDEFQRLLDEIFSNTLQKKQCSFLRAKKFKL